jgi:hypothetical protein
MKANHVKYTVEFDVPIKIEDSVMNPNAYDFITALMEQAVKAQAFYFTKQGIRPHAIRAKNIKVSYETSVQDYQI